MQAKPVIIGDRHIKERGEISKEAIKEILQEHKIWIQSNKTDGKCADFSNKILKFVDFSGIDLTDAIFFNSNLRDSNFKNARLVLADFRYCKLNFAKFDYANLGLADFYNASTKLASFEGADLRHAKMLTFDECYVRNARFDRINSFLFNIISSLIHWRTNDHWSILRQAYGGPQFKILMLYVVLFMTPYFGRAAVLSVIGQLEQKTIEFTEQLLENVNNNIKLRDAIEKIHREVLIKYEQRSLFSVLLHLDKGMFNAILGIILIVYNCGIYYLLVRIGTLRDHEERTGYTPIVGTCSTLWKLHIVVTILFIISALTFIYNSIEMLCTPILVSRQ